MSQLLVQGLNVSYDEIRALVEVEFSVEEGEFFCIVGPTNAGKSTLLKTLAGLVRPDSGTISLKGRDVTRAEPKDRRVSLLFQNIALFPNLTGFENMAFALRTAGVPDDKIRKRISELAETLKVGHVLERLPRTFSGGEQQRIAIGRAIAKPSELLMLDEPLTNLDARIRISLRVEFKEIHRRSGQTIIYVTHDQVEAMSMSDRIAVLHEGRFQQISTPDEVYRRPANRFVAEFIGQPPMNILPAEVSQHGRVPGVSIGGIPFAMPGLARVGERVTLPDTLAVGIRPESVQVSATQSSVTPHQAQIVWVEHLGSRSVIDLRFGDQTVKAKLASDSPMKAQDLTWFGFQPQVEHLLDSNTDMFIR